jgi:glutamate racemase
MQGRIKKAALLIFLFPFFYSCPDKKQLTLVEKLDIFFQKSEVTIAVTDSGLGGLSIMADAAERMREAKVFQKVNFVFFNALFSNEGGYNSLKTRREKIRIFDSALRSLEKNFHPDLVLIGCNTLSTIYEETSFSQETIIPVVGIIEAGVELIAQNLKTSPDSKVIIFATQTTVSEETHKKKLEEKGIHSERIILEACPELVNYIEKGYDSEETGMLISAYVEEALQKAQNIQLPLYVSLNCTHYGYSLDLWREAFRSNHLEPLDFLNPNSKMSDFLFEPQRRNRFTSTEISSRVISMVKISPERMDSIGEWLKRISPGTAEALFSYELRENLFEWRKYLTSE